MGLQAKCGVVSLACGVSVFLGLFPPEVAGACGIFPWLKGIPGIPWIISLGIDDGHCQAFAKSLFEQVYDAVSVDVYAQGRNKPLEFRYEIVEVVLHFKVLELLIGLRLDVDIVECVFECLFKGGPVPFVGVCSSPGDTSLEFFHLLFLP